MNFILTDYATSWFSTNPGQSPILSEFRLGSEFNYLPDASSDVDVRGNVLFSGMPGSPVLLPSGEIQYGLFIDTSVGDFEWGEIGLFHNGSLFALGSLSTLQYKRKIESFQDGNFTSVLALINPSSSYGVLEVANSANELNVQRRNSIDLLPPAQSSYPNVFLVPSPTDPERGTLAFATGSTWNLAGYEQEGFTGTLAGATANTVELDGVPVPELEDGKWIICFTDGASAGFVRSGSYDSGTNTITLSSPLPWMPEAGDRVRIALFTQPATLPALPPIWNQLDPALEASDLNQLMDLDAFFSSLLKRDGADAMTGTFRMGGFRIINVGAPVDQTDAATKGYVDTSVSSATAGLVGIAAVNSAIADATADFPTTTEVSTQISLEVQSSLVSALAGYSTTVQMDQAIEDAIAPLATTGYVDAQVDSVRGDWATISYVDSEILNAVNPLASQTDLAAAVLGLAAQTYVDLADAQLVPRNGSRSMTGNLDMGEFRVTELAEPTATNDATTKNYVDVLAATRLPRNGSAPMTGALDLGGFKAVNLALPTVGTDAASKAYVDANRDAAVALLVARDGSRPFTASQDFGGFRLLNVATPTVNSDGATKGYVDAARDAAVLQLLPLNGARPMTGSLNAGGFRVTNLPTLPYAGSASTDAASLGTVVGIVTEDVGALSDRAMLLDGTQPMAAPMNMNNHRIYGLASPSAAGDATPRSYVDTAISGLNEAGLLRLNGSRPMVGSLNMNTNYVINLPTVPLMDGPNPVLSQATSLALVQSTVASSLTGLLRADGSVPMAGDLNVSLHRILGVLDPVDDTDAANKQFVDQSTESLMRVDGSRPMTGALNMDTRRVYGLPATVVGATDAVSVAYLDSRLSVDFNDVLLQNGTRAMEADLDFGTFKAINLSPPTADTDAATKQYVDDTVTGMDSSGFLLRDGTRPMSGSLDMNNWNINNLPAFNPTIAGHTWTPGWPVGFPDDWPVDLRQAASIAHVSLAWNHTNQLVTQRLDGTLPFPGAPFLNNNRILALGAPIDPTDAATKDYVDTTVSGGATAFVRRDGTTTMTGSLDMGTHRLLNVVDPVNAQDAATRNYVESRLSIVIRRDGTLAMQGNLNLGTFRILNVALPTASSDAANKQYVDETVSLGFSSVVPRNGALPMTASLNSAGFRLINVGAPTNDADAATKLYVDNLESRALMANGTNAATAILPMGGFRISGLGTPLVDTDATTKAYVDSLAGGSLLADGSRPMAANFNLGGFLLNNVAEPVINTDAATKGYVDAFITSIFGQFIQVDGGNAMAANLDLGSNRIVNVVNPVNPQDVATKDYVDAAAVGGGSGSVVSVGLSAPTGFTVTGSPVTVSGTLNLAFTAGYSLPTNASQALWNQAVTDIGDHIGSGGAAHAEATTSVAGFMSAADKTKLNGIASGATANTGTVTSVAASVPTGFEVSAAVTTSGTLAISYAAGYSLPTDAAQADWSAAFGWGDHALAGYLVPADIGVTVQGYTANLAGWSAIAPSTKQDTLVSATNIKTINGESILGSGDIVVTGGGGGVSPTDPAEVLSLGVGTPASGVTGEIRATGDISANFTSDERLKTNLVRISNAREILRELKGYYHDWTDEYIASRGGEDGYFVVKNDVSLLAQQIQKVIPQAIRVRKDGYLAVRYERMIPFVVEQGNALDEAITQLEYNQHTLATFLHKVASSVGIDASELEYIINKKD